MLSLLAALALGQCATGVNDGYQQVCGRKDFQSSIAALKGSDPNGVAAYLVGDIWHTGSFKAGANGGTLALVGRATGTAAPEVTINSSNYRSDGPLLNLNVTAENGTAHNVSGFDVRGNLKLNGGPGNSALTGHGQFIDNTGLPNHVAMTCAPGQGLTLEGRYNDPEGGASTGKFSTNIDGGMWIDGGYLPFGANHGSLTISNSVWMEAGMMMDIRNKKSGVGALTDLVYFVDVQGGFGSLAQLRRADFGACPGSHIITNYGAQYVYGARTSTQLYAADEDRWYWCSATGWRPMNGESSSAGLGFGAGAIALGALAVCRRRLS